MSNGTQSQTATSGAASPAANAGSGQVVATNTPNTQNQLTVQQAEFTATFVVPTNTFGDTLPIIPTAARVVSGRVLFHLVIEVTVKRGEAVAPGVTVTLGSSRANANDTFTSRNPVTDANGKATFVLETRVAGSLTVRATNTNITSVPLAQTLREAWYEAGFYITHYTVANESDFNGPAENFNGMSEPHRRDFMVGGRGVAMQGTGLASNGRYVTITNPTAVAWAPRYTELSSPADAQFTYVNAPAGRFNPVVDGTSIAIDPTVIPGRHRVYIRSSGGQRVIGERRADDTGGAIRGAHIDVFKNGGDAAARAWTNEGGNLNGAWVKYLGP